MNASAVGVAVTREVGTEIVPTPPDPPSVVEDEIPSAGGVWMIRSEIPPGPSSLWSPPGGVPVKSIRSSCRPLQVSPAATTHAVSSTPARRIECWPIRVVPST